MHPRTRPDHLCGDKAYSSRRNRRYLRRRQIRHTIPERRDQQAHRRRRGSAGGRPTSFNRDRYAHRNEVERTVDALKGFRAVATRFDKRAYVVQGTVTAAAIRLWLRSSGRELTEAVKAVGVVGATGAGVGGAGEPSDWPPGWHGA
ncbi:hypothetical protein Srufu_078920 [Streptomyces libani subsp. rufus]|nr:hypothetical protein Srufu_000060 [Streptomyces libani subsp. rufus]BCK73939.1 hypothetical protein Srufu_078920 [Streptomyces libani subsp. rufus]